MKPSEKLLKIRNSKFINSIVVLDRMEYLQDKSRVRVKALRFHLNIKNEFSEEVFPTIFDEPAEVRYEDYTQDVQLKPKDSPELNVWFHHSYYPSSGDHWKTFLKKINKNSEIMFRVRINNNSDKDRERGTCHHQLFGFINDDCYFLDDFFGDQNSASPVRW
jgi:hypothetical protein